MMRTRSTTHREGFRSWALRNVLIPTADLYYGERLMRRLRFLEQAQWWERSRLEAFRAESIAELIATAYTEVPFYHQLMKASGVTPSDVQRPEDLHRLPIVTKEMLRDAYPHSVVRRTGQKTYEAYSSGSTGPKTVVCEDHETAGVYRSSVLLTLEWAGWRLGESHLQVGAEPSRSAQHRLKDFFLRCHYFSVFDIHDDNSDNGLDRALDWIDRNNLKHLWGFPRSLYFIARRARQRGWNRPLQSIVTWGDSLYDHYRETLERAFQTRVFDTYGCAEGFQVAAQCGVGQNFHIHELDVIVELVDDDARPVAQGEPGNVIITRLHPGPMPLIRYRVGDIAVRSSKETCPCGRGLALLGGIEGRDVEVVLTPCGNRLHARQIARVLNHCREIDTLQILQEKPDSIVVWVIPSREHRGSTEWHAKFLSMLRECGAQGLHIELKIVDNMPRLHTNKRPLVVNKLLPDRAMGLRPGITRVLLEG